MDGTEDAGIARRDVGQQADCMSRLRPTAAYAWPRLPATINASGWSGPEGATIGREQRFEARDGALRFAGLLRRQRDQVARAQRIAMRRAEPLAAAERLGAERPPRRGDQGERRGPVRASRRTPWMSIAEEAPPGVEGGAVVTGGCFRLPRSQPGEAGIVPGGECVGTCRGAQPIGDASASIAAAIASSTDPDSMSVGSSWFSASRSIRSSSATAARRAATARRASAKHSA
jgi:hypothetical protein